jgi:twitching motility protein PilT
MDLGEEIDVSLFKGTERAKVFALLEKMAISGASDLRLASDRVPHWTNLGVTEPVPDEDIWTKKEIISALYKLSGVDNWQTFLDEWRLDFSFTYKDKINGRFRISMVSERNKPAAVLRLIRSTIPTMDELELPSALYEIPKKKIGLYLFCGRTGSGKSTTQASIINEINRTRQVSINTIEQPIEYDFEDAKAFVFQREIGIDSKSYSLALIDLLRHAPDVVLIGELREAEEVRAALQLAENSLVLSTLHTSSIYNTIDRLLLMFEHQEQQSVKSALLRVLGGITIQELHRTNDGTQRKASFEIGMMTDDLRKAIKDDIDKNEFNAILESGVGGNQTMAQSLQNLVL